MAFLVADLQIVHLVADCASRRSRNKSLHTISTANLLGHAEPQGAEEAAAAAAAEPGDARTSQSSAAGDCAAERAPPQQQHMTAHSSPQHSLTRSGNASVRSSSSSSSAVDPERGQGPAAHAEGCTGGDEEPAVMTDVDVMHGDALRVAAVEEQAAHSGTTSRQVGRNPPLGNPLSLHKPSRLG